MAYTTPGANPDWKTGNCADPIVDHINEQQGRDVWAELGGRPDGWRSAAAFYRRHDVRNLAELVDIVLEAVPVHHARRGDVVMINGGLAISRGDVCEGIDGTGSITAATKAWRV